MAESIPRQVRQLVLIRAGNACEVCGIEGALELHHRRYRSRGGQHTAGNLIALCGWGNHTGHHGWAHTDQLAAVWGVSVNSWADPLTVPLWSPQRRAWGLLDDDGGWTPID